MAKPALSNACRSTSFQMELTGHFALFARLSDEKPRTLNVLRRFLSRLHKEADEFQPRSLLDLGCGHGLLSAGIAEYYSEVMKRPLEFAVLVDQNLQLLEAAKDAVSAQIPETDIYCDDIFHAPLPLMKPYTRYDIALVSNVLYYAPDQAALQRPLDAVHRRLSNFGVMPIIHEGRTDQLNRLQEISGSNVVPDVTEQVDRWTASHGHEKHDVEFAAEIILPNANDESWDKFARVSWTAERLPEFQEEEKNLMLILEFLASEPFGDLAQRQQLKYFLKEARDILEQCNYRFPLRQIMQVTLPEYACVSLRKGCQTATMECAA